MSTGEGISPRDAKRSDNTSGFKGVYLHQKGRYVAMIKHNRKSIYLGLYDTPEEAAAAYFQKSKELFGKFGA